MDGSAGAWPLGRCPEIVHVFCLFLCHKVLDKVVSQTDASLKLAVIPEMLRQGAVWNVLLESPVGDWADVLG